MTGLIFTASTLTALQLLPAIALGAVAVYLLLPGQLPAEQHRWRMGAAGAGALALCGLGWQLLPAAAWWPVPVARSVPAQLLLPLTGLVAVLAAAYVVLAGDISRAGRGFLVLVISVAALLLQVGAPVPALILAAGSGGWWLLRPAEGPARRPAPAGRPAAHQQRSLHEPLLACFTAGLLTTLLVTVVHGSLVLEAGPAAARSRQPILPDRKTVQRTLNREPAVLSIEPARSQFAGLFDAAWSTQPVTVGLLAAGAITLLLARPPGWSGTQRRNARSATAEVADADFTPREADRPEGEEGA